MNLTFSVQRRHARASARAILLISAAGIFAAGAFAQNWNYQSRALLPGNLVVSRSVYDNNPNNVSLGEPLPPGCIAANVAAGSCVSAAYDGTYPFVFNNAPIDGSFGITSRIFIDQISPLGQRLSTIEVPNSLQPWVTPSTDQLVTSFSSKSELALNLSTDHHYITFMGYKADVNQVDVSNSNTFGAVDKTNPAGFSVYRAVAVMDRDANFTFTLTNAYSGNNGRAAIWYNTNGANVFYAAGNAGNGSNPQPPNVVLGAGAQIMTPSTEPESSQDPGTPTPVGTFSVTQLGDKPDKVGKDDNFRGMTIFNNVLYYTKGSGGNGVNTVYFVDTTGTACPDGVGLPSPAATLPTEPFSAYNPVTGTPNNMCVLKGFPTLSNKNGTPVNFPFGLWFADANTLYVADEGDGTNTYDPATNTYTDAAGQVNAGLEKWVFDSGTSTWVNVYTLKAGLDLGIPYVVPGYPLGHNAATGLPWLPATDGLRNITGAHLPFGLVIIYGISSTVSGSGDQGADPNKLFAIIDDVQNTSLSSAAWEQFFPVKFAGNLEVLRGVSFTPDTTNVVLY